MCGNCDILKPEFEKVSKENKNIPFIFVNPDVHTISSQMVDLTNIPMVVGFDNGDVVVSKFETSVSRNSRRSFKFFN